MRLAVAIVRPAVCLRSQLRCDLVRECAAAASSVMGLGYARTPLRGDRRLGAVVRNRQTHQLAVRNQSSLDADAGAHEADPAFGASSELLRTASTNGSSDKQHAPAIGLSGLRRSLLQHARG